MSKLMIYYYFFLIFIYHWNFSISCFCS